MGDKVLQTREDLLAAAHRLLGGRIDNELPGANDDAEAEYAEEMLVKAAAAHAQAAFDAEGAPGSTPAAEPPERAAAGTGFESAALDAATAEPAPLDEAAELPLAQIRIALTQAVGRLHGRDDNDSNRLAEGLQELLDGNAALNGGSLSPITPEEAKTLYAVWAGDAFDAEHLNTVQPKLEAIAGESWR